MKSEDPYYVEVQLKLNLVRQRMDHISDLTGKMAMAGTANLDNPRFVSLMNDFDNMIKSTDQLLDKMAAHLGIR